MRKVLTNFNLILTQIFLFIKKDYNIEVDYVDSINV